MVLHNGIAGEDLQGVHDGLDASTDGNLYSSAICCFGQAPRGVSIDANRVCSQVCVPPSNAKSLRALQPRHCTPPRRGNSHMMATTALAPARLALSMRTLEEGAGPRGCISAAAPAACESAVVGFFIWCQRMESELSTTAWGR